MKLTLIVKQVDANAFVTDSGESPTFPGSWEEANVYHVGDVIERDGRVFTVTQRRWRGRDLDLTVHERKKP